MPFSSFIDKSLLDLRSLFQYYYRFLFLLQLAGTFLFVCDSTKNAKHALYIALMTFSIPFFKPFVRDIMELDAMNTNEANALSPPSTDMDFIQDGVTADEEHGGDDDDEDNGLSDPAPGMSAFSTEESQELQKHLNDQLEACMSNYRSKVKQFFKEFVVFHDVATQVVEQWKAPFENQQAEQARLDTVESDVEKTMKNIPWMNPNLQHDMKW